jgi:endonuclease/exonuclease/phosphatase (EEP) superfamily protein YafD
MTPRGSNGRTVLLAALLSTSACARRPRDGTPPESPDPAAEPAASAASLGASPVHGATASGHVAIPAATSAKPRPGETLTLLSYNLYVYNEDLPGTAALIRRIDADVVVLQETIPAFEAALRDALGDLYPYMEFHVGPVGNGPGTMSKRPWTAGRYVPATNGWNGYWIGQFDLAGRPLQIANVHLHPTPFGSFDPRDAWAAYRGAEAVRLQQLGELAARLSALAPRSTVVLGDFNSLPGSATLRRASAMGFLDGLAPFAAGTSPTFHLGGAFFGIGFHIDHVLLGAELRPIAAAVIADGSSDHYPVVTTIAWKAGS